MAKKAYVGVNSVARRAKKIYIGVGGIARKVKKAYIGVAGIARLFFTFGELKYHANELDLSFDEGAATSDYAVLVTGQSAKAYDTSLTATTLAEPTTRTEGVFGAASTGEYNIFAGGYNRNLSGRYLSDVDCYNGSLTKVAVASLPAARSKKAGISVGNYALFGGGFGATGNGGQSDVIAYDSSLTQTIATNMYAAEPPGTSWNNNYGMFIGGKSGEYSGFYYQRVGAAYNSSLTKTEFAIEEPKGFADKHHCKAGQYALFAPGFTAVGDNYYWWPTVWAINGSLTIRQITSTSPGDPDGMASAGGYGIIYSSKINESTYSVTSGINVYDESLVRTAPFTLTNGAAFKGISFGEIALMGNNDVFAIE